MTNPRLIIKVEIASKTYIGNANFCHLKQKIKIVFKDYGY